MKGGYAGTILKVNLEKKEIVKDALDPQLIKLFIGGRGINSWLLYNPTTKHIK
jgi:aldehyde:ferredoxin oxidoreductase